jgi:hypothetical protein
VSEAGRGTLRDNGIMTAASDRGLVRRCSRLAQRRVHAYPRRSAARALHPSLKVGGGPIIRRPAREKGLYDVSFSPGYSTGRYTFFQTTAGVVVRVFFVSIDHLRSLGGLLENDYEFDAFSRNGLKLLIHDLKTAVGRKERFLLMEIRRQPPNRSRT